MSGAVCKKLEKQHTVYTIDLLGCGRSEKPYLTYTNYLYVQLITDFVKEVIKDTPTVIATGSSISFVTLAENMTNHYFTKSLLSIRQCLKNLTARQVTLLL